MWKRICLDSSFAPNDFFGCPLCTKEYIITDQSQGKGRHLPQVHDGMGAVHAKMQLLRGFFSSFCRSIQFILACIAADLGDSGLTCQDLGALRRFVLITLSGNARRDLSSAFRVEQIIPPALRHLPVISYAIWLTDQRESVRFSKTSKYNLIQTVWK